MPRTSTQQKTAPTLTDPAEAALTEDTGSRPASKKKAASKKTAAKKKAEAKKIEAKKARYARTDALHDALAQGGTRAELAEKVDELYVQNGGESKPSGARAMIDLHVPVLKHFAVIEENEDGRLTLAP